MIWERFSCSSSFSGPQIRLVLNEATFPLTTCIQSKSDKTYGTCSMVSFVKSNAASAQVSYANAVWNASCVANATVA